MSDSSQDLTDHSADPPTTVSFDRYVSYEDDGHTVICDRQNASAWITSSVVRTLEP